MANRYTVALSDESAYINYVVDGDSGYLMSAGSRSNAHYYADKFNAFVEGVVNGYDPRLWMWIHVDGSIAQQPQQQEEYDDHDDYVTDPFEDDEDNDCECDECLHSRGECDSDCSICEDDDSW